MGWTILVVDDEPLQLELLSDILTASGYRVVSAADGVEGLVRLAEAKAKGPAIDLVVTDISMPQMSGIEFARAISRRYPEIAIVAMTGVGSKEMLIDLLRAGVCEYLDKPFVPDALLEVVDRLIVGGHRPGVLQEIRRLRSELEGLVQAEVAKQQAEVIRWIRGGIRHRFNQPLTILTANISMFQRLLAREEVRCERSGLAESMLAEMRDAALCIRDLIQMMSSVQILETMPYAGGEKILDFERSAGLAGEEAP